MAKGALFVGWGSIVSGREKIAADVLNEAQQYLQRLQREGVIDGADVVLLEPHGGELEGFVLIKGEKEAISRLRTDDMFVHMIVGVQLVHNNVRVVGAYSGAEMHALLKLWDHQEARLLD
jgi:hypothetical protein